MEQEYEQEQEQEVAQSRLKWSVVLVFLRVALLVGLASLLAGCSPKSSPSDSPATQSEKKGETEKKNEPAKKSEPESRVKRGPGGEVIVTLDAATQKTMGLETSPLAPAQLPPEAKAYGRVLDVTPLASLITELSAAAAAARASEAELKRLQTLASQNNTSERALQAAQAAAVHDQTQLESARLRLVASWGTAIAGQKDLPAFVQSLVSLSSALVQLDLPAGQPISGQPAGARLLALGDETHPISATFLGPATMTDPQLQGRAFFFLVESNGYRLAPGASVTGFMNLPGDPQSGLLVPRDAVLRYNGTAWVYVEGEKDTFRRQEVALNHPLADGWFVSEGLKPQDKIVTTGAQQILSEELKGQGGEE